MILLFGPAGSGKSVQGKLLTDRLGWQWLSTGRMIRRSGTQEMQDIIKNGTLLPTSMMNELLVGELEKQASNRIVLDGYPRRLDQAEWLVQHAQDVDMTVDLVVMLEIPEKEIIDRLMLRGRADDTPSVIADRLAIYLQDADEIINYLRDQGVAVARVDGVGSIEDIHERIKSAMQTHHLLDKVV